MSLKIIIFKKFEMAKIPVWQFEVSQYIGSVHDCRNFDQAALKMSQPALGRFPREAQSSTGKINEEEEEPYQGALLKTNDKILY